MRLESRYRLLLAAYPAAHLERYQEEMLATLMEGAGPQQSFPRAREVFDLLWNALHLHLDRRELPRVSDPRWADAGAVFGLLGAVLIAVRFLDGPSATALEAMRFERVDGPLWSHIPWKGYAVAGVWLLVALLAMVAWRRVAAMLAWLTALAFASWLFYGYPSNPPSLPESWPLLVLSVTTAACLTLPAPDRRAAALLGKTLTGPAVVTTALVGMAPSFEALSIHRIPFPEGGYLLSYWGDGVLPGHLNLAVSLVSSAFAAVTVVVLRKVGPPIRRRLYVLTAPALLITVIVVNTFDGFAASSMRFWPTPVMLTAGQWLALSLLPLTAWAAGILLVRRADMLDASTR